MHFGHDRQAGFFAGFGQQFQALQSQSLELVRRGAGLVGASAQHGGAAVAHSAGRGHQLFARFHRTRPGDHDRRLAADLDLADPDDGSLLAGLDRSEFETMSDVDERVHRRQQAQRFVVVAIEFGLIRHHHDAARFPHNMGLNAAILEGGDNSQDILACCRISHADQHDDSLPYLCSSRLVLQDPRYLNSAFIACNGPTTQASSFCFEAATSRKNRYCQGVPLIGRLTRLSKSI